MAWTWVDYIAYVGVQKYVLHNVEKFNVTIFFIVD